MKMNVQRNTHGQTYIIKCTHVKDVFIKDIRILKIEVNGSKLKCQMVNEYLHNKYIPVDCFSAWFKCRNRSVNHFPLNNVD